MLDDTPGSVASRRTQFLEAGEKDFEHRSIVMPKGDLYFGSEFEDQAFIRVGCIIEAGEMDSLSLDLQDQAQMTYPNELVRLNPSIDPSGDTIDLWEHYSFSDQEERVRPAKIFY